MKSTGLAKTQNYDLNKLFKETLPKHFDNPEAKSALEEAKKKQQTAYGIMGILVVLGVGSIYTDFVQQKDNKWLPWVLDIGGIIIGVWLSQKARTTEMKDFEKDYKNLIGFNERRREALKLKEKLEKELEENCSNFIKKYTLENKMRGLGSLSYLLNANIDVKQLTDLLKNSDK